MSENAPISGYSANETHDCIHPKLQEIEEYKFLLISGITIYRIQQFDKQILLPRKRQIIDILIQAFVVVWSINLYPIMSSYCFLKKFSIQWDSLGINQKYQQHTNTLTHSSTIEGNLCESY